MHPYKSIISKTMRKNFTNKNEAIFTPNEMTVTPAVRTFGGSTSMLQINSSGVMPTEATKITKNILMSGVQDQPDISEPFT